MISFPVQIKLSKEYPKVIRGLYFCNVDDILKNKRAFLLSNVFENTKPMCICSNHVFGIIFLGNPKKINKSEIKDLEEINSKWGSEEFLWKYPIKNIITLKDIVPIPLPHRFKIQKVL